MWRRPTPKWPFLSRRGCTRKLIVRAAHFLIISNRRSFPRILHYECGEKPRNRFRYFVLDGGWLIKWRYWCMNFYKSLDSLGILSRFLEIIMSWIIWSRNSWILDLVLGGIGRFFGVPILRLSLRAACSLSLMDILPPVELRLLLVFKPPSVTSV